MYAPAIVLLPSCLIPLAKKSCRMARNGSPKRTQGPPKVGEAVLPKNSADREMFPSARAVLAHACEPQKRPLQSPRRGGPCRLNETFIGEIHYIHLSQAHHRQRYAA